MPAQLSPWYKVDYPGPFLPVTQSTMGQQKITVTFYGADVVKGQALLDALEASGQQIDSVQKTICAAYSMSGYYAPDQTMTITFWAKMFAEPPAPLAPLLVPEGA